MEQSRESLTQLYQQLSDEALLDRAAGGGLTELAQSVADAQLRLRGMEPPPRVQRGDDGFARPPPSPTEDDSVYDGDWQMVRRQLDPTEAHVLSACLLSAGIPAIVADTHFVQAYHLMAGAVGGASVRVPATRLEEARSVLAAFERGDLALDDDFDPSASGS